MHVLHKHARHHPHLSFLTVNPGFAYGKLPLYLRQTPAFLRSICKCIYMQKWFELQIVQIMHDRNKKGEMFVRFAFFDYFCIRVDMNKRNE